MRFQEGKAVIELHVKCVFPIEISCMLYGRKLRLPKLLLRGDDGFHNRPSFFSSSITLINLRLGIQPSIPRIR